MNPSRRVPMDLVFAKASAFYTEMYTSAREVRPSHPTETLLLTPLLAPVSQRNTGL